MKHKGRLLTAVLAGFGMAVLILDTKTALAAGAEGVKLCIWTLIPSLFPFFLISILLTSALAGFRLPFLAPLGSLLRIPRGSETLVILGLLGGYPSGAQTIAQARRSGGLSKEDAKRMLAFCSNAGSSFLFGVGARLFPQMWICWLLWAIHIISAWTVAVLTPGGSRNTVELQASTHISITAALKASIEVMALVCGWVVLFRVLLGFAERWFIWLLPKQAQLFLVGITEMTNGCTSLLEVECIGLRMTLCSVFLGFGGLCVALQTKSVTAGTDSSLYLPGKITQAAVSFLLCMPAQLLLPAEQRMHVSLPAVIACGVAVAGYGFITRKLKIAVDFPSSLVYNQKKNRGNVYAVSQENR